MCTQLEEIASTLGPWFSLVLEDQNKLPLDHPWGSSDIYVEISKYIPQVQK